VDSKETVKNEWSAENQAAAATSKEEDEDEKEWDSDSADYEAEFYDDSTVQQQQQQNSDELYRSRSRRDKLSIVQWFRETSKISKYKFSPRYEPDGVFLRIRNLSLNDSGLFKCKFINGFGTLTSKVNLKVVVRPQSSNSATTTTTTTNEPIIINAMANSRAKLMPVFHNSNAPSYQIYRKQKGANVRFNCRAHAPLGKPDIVWLKNGQILNEEDYGLTRCVQCFCFLTRKKIE
jgi:hypothetical protein